MQALEEQFSQKDGYMIQYHKFNFKECSGDPCLEIIVPPNNEHWLIGKEPTEAKVIITISDYVNLFVHTIPYRSDCHILIFGEKIMTP